MVCGSPTFLLVLEKARFHTTMSRGYKCKQKLGLLPLTSLRQDGARSQIQNTHFSRYYEPASSGASWRLAGKRFMKAFFPVCTREKICMLLTFTLGWVKV